MVDFSFDGLFKTTNMGIPSLDPLPTQTYLSRSYYGYSITVQSIIFLYFVAYFALSIIRVLKKIKNPKFREITQDLMAQQDPILKKDQNISSQKTVKKNYNKRKNSPQAQNNDEQVGQQKVMKMIPYRFDGQQQQQIRRRQREAQQQLQKRQEDKYVATRLDEQTKPKQQQQPQENNQDFNDYHDEKQEYYIELDNKMMFLQPFLISFIICNNMFAADIVSVLALILMFVSYYLFNIMERLSHIKFTPIVFMGFSIIGYLSFFINDHDLTT